MFDICYIFKNQIKSHLDIFLLSQSLSSTTSHENFPFHYIFSQTPVFSQAIQLSPYTYNPQTEKQKF